LAEPHHVVVDGSNLATEGRTSPSLKQLDEAVRAYAAEDPDASIIVVVDATFEHRVSEEERDEVRAAMLNGEVISPPAGAIGRGDAFVLRIAERTGAIVLSNDSFQEFHGEHPWLFDEGRLIGGKPVPGVGWIFTPRIPIRGPKSRAATAEAKSKKRDPDSAPAKAAELARAAKKAAKRGPKAKKATSKAVSTVDSSWPITPTVPPPGRVKVDPVLSNAIEEAVEEALHPAKPSKSKGSTKKAAPPKGSKARRAAASTTPDMSSDANRAETKRTTPPPAVNEPLAFINFVASFAVGTTVGGEVVSFTSHGAMVDVAIPEGGVLHCYIPLTAMGTPPPTKARQVLKKGEVRAFVLAGLDPPRRVAELSLPGSPETATGDAQKRAPRSEGRGPAAVAVNAALREASEDGKTLQTLPAKKTSGKKAAKKSAPVKAASKKAAGTKKAAAATAKSAPPLEKAPAKKAPAKKAPAEKVAAKKAASKKAPAKKVAAKKAEAKKVGAKKTAKAKQDPAKAAGV
jgi:Zc3h12a-like Ribonuclease NYN domain